MSLVGKNYEKDHLLGGTGIEGVMPSINFGKYGGHEGILEELGILDVANKVVDNWQASTPYIAMNMIPIVLSTPKAFEYFEDTKGWQALWIKFFTKHAKTITGIDTGLEIATDDTNFGSNNEVFKVYTNTKRKASALATTHTEIGGIAFTNFLETIIRYTMADEDSKKPLIVSTLDYDKIPTWGPEMYTGSIMFVEPDITFSKVTKNALLINIFPTTSPEKKMQKDPQADGAKLEISTDWSSITLPPRVTLKLASTLLKAASLHSIIPDNTTLSPINGVNPDIADIK